MYQIDTDILSYLLKGDHRVVQRFMPHLMSEGTIHLSVITVYEIKKGLYHLNSKRRLAAFDELLNDCIIHALTAEIADHAAALKGRLMQLGKGIDHLDLLIGATAHYFGHAIVTNNEEHFAMIPDLKIENWTK